MIAKEDLWDFRTNGEYDELMSYAGFERRMKSISLCSSEESQSFHPIANSDWQIFDRLLKPTTIEKRCRNKFFYDEPDFEGNIFTLTTSGGCYSFKSKWRNRISSLDASKPSLCVIAWDNLDCEGSSIRLELTTAASKNKNLKLVDFDKKIKSVNLCSQAQAEDDNGRAIQNPDDYRKLDINAIALEEHNKFRSQHGIDPLSSDEKLQSVAQTFADYLASSDKLYHSSDIQYGENLAGISTQDKETALKEAIQAWYNEISNYDFQNPRYSIRGLKAGHFTALVWKTTTKVGVGMAWNPKRRWWVVVANYSHLGISKELTQKNVFPPVIL
ncbi:Golgi-associated plant pathogenesis-related protein 1 [Orchesella cincta]|uniref:Golgi-associated plant pathogenesis-related protein 1 n=1 Tax=Orchesella cincta TaxID=48709 RepID=A0A1D2M2B2_ORCCI|nr:Golgi-associated plant pathogenesis-related protein 1 [Orchesella cincta]